MVGMQSEGSGAPEEGRGALAAQASLSTPERSRVPWPASSALLPVLLWGPNSVLPTHQGHIPTCPVSDPASSPYAYPRSSPLACQCSVWAYRLALAGAEAQAGTQEAVPGCGLGFISGALLPSSGPKQSGRKCYPFSFLECLWRKTV